MNKKRIAWVIPSPEKGSGGLRTIFNNAFHLEQKYKVENYFYILPAEYHVSNLETTKENIHLWFNYKINNLYQGIFPIEDYDAIIVTSNETADFISSKKYNKVIYFIQDYEPYFYPIGSNSIVAKNSYQYNYKKLTIGKWLSSKIGKETNEEIPYCNFGADLNIYKSHNRKASEKAICAIFQPGKYRRASSILIDAIKVLNATQPDLTIYLYGESIDNEQQYEIKADFLGVISPKQCCDLYNKCMCGISLSTTNPSRIPFEMMASGLPVVDIYTENNLFDFPEEGILLADPTPESIAQSVTKVITDDSVNNYMSQSGLKFMSTRNTENESLEFADIINSYINNTDSKYIKPQISYKKKPIEVSSDIVKIANSIKLEKYIKIIDSQKIKKCHDLQLKLNISNEKINKIKVAVWRGANQADIKWITLKNKPDSDINAYIEMSALNNDIYLPLNIHLYYEYAGDLKFIAAHSLLVDNTTEVEKISSGQLIDKLNTNEVSLKILNCNKYPKLKVKIKNFLNIKTI